MRNGSAYRMPDTIYCAIGAYGTDGPRDSSKSKFPSLFKHRQNRCLDGIDQRKLRFAEVIRVIRSTSVISALVAAAVLSAPSAAADDNEYLNKLQDRYEFLTPQQLLAEGQRVCAAERSGVLVTRQDHDGDE